MIARKQLLTAIKGTGKSGSFSHTGEEFGAVSVVNDLRTEVPIAQSS